MQGTVGGAAISAATMQSSMEVPQELKIKLYMTPQSHSSEYISEGNEIAISNGYLYFSVHFSIIYSRQGMETKNVG